MTILWIVCTVVFIFGLIQWARSGAVLWDIFHIEENKDPEDLAGKQRKELAIQRMERDSDALLRSSFRIIGVLALATWVFLTLTVVFDSLGIDLIDRLSFKARSFWGSPVVRAGNTNTSAAAGGNRREDLLKSLGGGLRR